MSVNIEDRPIEKVRSEVIDQLIMNYSHGEISYQAFERRLDKAMELTSNTALLALVDDLTLGIDKVYIENKKQDLALDYQLGHTEESDQTLNIFSSGNRSGAWHVAKKITSFSLFSEATLDFTEAKFTHPVVRIKLFSLFSCDNIYIPENVHVVSKAFCIFGSVDNLSSGHIDENTPTIIVEGFAVFSSVNIKFKRTIKERFVEFADNLKKIFS